MKKAMELMKLINKENEKARANDTAVEPVTVSVEEIIKASEGVEPNTVVSVKGAVQYAKREYVSVVSKDKDMALAYLNASKRDYPLGNGDASEHRFVLYNDTLYTRNLTSGDVRPVTNPKYIQRWAVLVALTNVTARPLVALYNTKTNSYNEDWSSAVMGLAVGYKQIANVTDIKRKVNAIKDSKHISNACKCWILERLAMFCFNQNTDTSNLISRLCLEASAQLNGVSLSEALGRKYGEVENTDTLGTWYASRATKYTMFELILYGVISALIVLMFYFTIAPSMGMEAFLQVAFFCAVVFIISMTGIAFVSAKIDKCTMRSKMFDEWYTPSYRMDKQEFTDYIKAIRYVFHTKETVAEKCTVD